MFTAIHNPDLYHGKLPWNKFEGWYFRVCDSKGNAFAFIPGIYQLGALMARHSFIQFLSGTDGTFEYNEFELNAFKAQNKPFKFYIGKNTFSLDGLKADFGNSLPVKADLTFHDVVKWDKHSKLHRSMGLYNLIPYMECYSQVLAMDMKVSGTIEVNGKQVILQNAHGYSEKNWGAAFPYSWIWVQSNMFNECIETVSITASIAHIPFVLGSFSGFLIGLQLGNAFHKFTSMNGSKLTIKECGNDVEIHVENSKSIMKIKTTSHPESFILCKAPKSGLMRPFVRETLTAKVHIILEERGSNRIIFQGTGINAGIEYGGEYKELFTFGSD